MLPSCTGKTLVGIQVIGVMSFRSLTFARTMTGYRDSKVLELWPAEVALAGMAYQDIFSLVWNWVLESMSLEIGPPPGELSDVSRRSILIPVVSTCIMVLDLTTEYISV